VQRRTAELEPVHRRVQQAQRRLVFRMDELSSRPPKGKGLSRRHRAALGDRLAALAEDLLADGPDAELEALLERHGGMTPDERRNLELELAQEMMSGIFGADAVAGHEADDVESLMTHVREKVAAQAEAQQREHEEREAARAARGRRPTRAEQAAQRKAEAAREASRSVQEIYRKLASALHPDREPDEPQRRRKTLLMQRVNQA
jgi:hypothetical protein